jgi:uncharacterized membrane protein YkvI
MEFEQEIAKLVVIFTFANLIASLIGFVALVSLGPVIGLIVLIPIVILLPVGFQYLYIRKKTDQK